MRYLEWRRLDQRKGPGCLQAALITTLGFFASGGLGFSADPDLPAQESLDALLKKPFSELVKMPIPTIGSASGFPQPVSQAPASVSIVTREDIQRYGYRTLSDLLRSVPGLHMTYDRLYSFVGVRGVNPGDFNSRMLLLVDGHRLNQNLSDAALVETGFILDLDLVDRVEIIRGPGSVLYGNNAVFGVINVVTRPPASLGKYGTEASVSYGSFDTWQARATYGHTFTNGPAFLVSGTYFDSPGQSRLFFEEFDQPANNHGVFEDGDADRFYSAFGSVAYTGFTLQGGWVDREKHNPTAQHGTAFNDNRHAVTDTRAYLDLAFAHEFDQDLNLKARAYYDRYEFAGTFPFTAGLTNLERDDRLGQWWGLEAQLSKVFNERHTLVVGAEYRDDFDQRRDYYQAEPTYESLSTLERDRQSYAAFVNGEVSLVKDKLALNAGLRYDGYAQFEDSINPRAALIYHPWPTTTLKAIYGTAFRTPNFFELFDSFHQDIGPEKITTYELMAEQEISKVFRASLAGFWNDLDDVIAFDFQSDDPHYRNLEGATAKGLEVGLEAHGVEGWTKGLRGRLSYTYQQTENRETGLELIDSPNHLAKLSVSVPVWREKVFASAEVQYTSDRATAVVAPGGVYERGARADDFVVVNLNLFARDLIKDHLEVSAGIYNLFDETYHDPATPWHTQDLIPQDGRTFRVKLTMRF